VEELLVVEKAAATAVAYACVRDMAAASKSGSAQSNAAVAVSQGGPRSELNRKQQPARTAQRVSKQRDELLYTDIITAGTEHNRRGRRQPLGGVAAKYLFVLRVAWPAARCAGRQCGCMHA